MKKLLMVITLLMLAMPCLSTNADTVKNMGYISVNATESKEIVPNTANVTFSVETTDVDSKRASERNNQITSKIVSALKEVLKEDKNANIQTKNFNLRPNYKTNKNTDETSIKNYTAINSIVVKTTSVDKVSALIDTAIKNNVSNVNGVTFTLENQDQYAEELSNEAIQKAKYLADKAALSLKQKVVGIKSIRINIYQQNANGVRLYKAASSADANTTTATPIESGKVQLNASVDAEFYVK